MFQHNPIWPFHHADKRTSADFVQADRTKLTSGSDSRNDRDRILFFDSVRYSLKSPGTRWVTPIRQQTQRFQGHRNRCTLIFERHPLLLVVLFASHFDGDGTGRERARINQKSSMFDKGDSHWAFILAILMSLPQKSNAQGFPPINCHILGLQVICPDDSLTKDDGRGTSGCWVIHCPYDD